MNRDKTHISLAMEIFLTLAICCGICFNSFVGISAEANIYANDVMATYRTITNNYIRAYKILKMEAVTQIQKDPSFEDMQTWLQSREAAFRDAIGEGVYDGFAFTYKGGYAHSWNYGDYSNYDPNKRPWYQMARKAEGDIVVVPPYETYLSGTSHVRKYDTLRLSVAQRLNDEISFDFDLDVKEINALIAGKDTIYNGTIGFFYDSNGYVLSSSNPVYYGHNVNTVDEKITGDISALLKNRDHGRYGIRLGYVDKQLKVIYGRTNDNGDTLCLLIPFIEVFVRNFLFVFILAALLIAIEIIYYKRNKQYMDALETNRLALQDALQHAENASHAKGDFMSHMSHEIRTPLNAIIGYLELARDEKGDTEKVENCIEKSQNASKHLLSIINDVLDVSSIESGRMKLAHEKFDLKMMISTLTELFYSQARNKGVSFEVKMGALDGEYVVGDELRVRQILVNLLSNAIKFTGTGGSVVLGVKQLGLVDNKMQLEFMVQDTGIGMSKEYQARIFKPFEQESATTARSYGGTGLGLSISNNLVHMMGGSIAVDSVQNQGTTFKVNLAFERAQEENSAQNAPLDFNHLRILVVDDDPDTCSYMDKLLRRMGIKCDTVTSGKKALRRVMTRNESGRPYDMCIIDWHMEEMDGMETARQVRKLSDEKLPIIIATAYDTSALEEEAKSVGVDKVIAKPLFQSTLMDLLVNNYGKYKPVGEDKVVSKEELKGLKILLAEDNDMNMEIALAILQKAGLVVTPVRNGLQAVDTFTGAPQGTFDAILMDIQMPVMDGYTATRKIRESSHPEAKSIPIIAMTANAFSEDVTAAMAAGMNDHVAKPISYDRLFASLKKFVKKANGKVN